MPFQPNECAYCGEKAWCENRQGKPQCRACKVVRFFQNVLYDPIGFELLLWQEHCLRGIFGPSTDDGTRLVRQAYISVPKKNGKSFLLGGLPLYHLICEVDLEPMPLKVFGAAAAKDQAGIVYDVAAELVDASPILQKRLRLLRSTKRIVRRDGRGLYQVLAGDGDVEDGKEPSLVIVDELHRWKLPRNVTNHTVLKKGRISRNQALFAQISTRGEEFECPLWEEEDDYAQRILDGSIEEPRYFAFIAAADAERDQRDPDYWKTQEARVAANPSHEENGGFLRDDAISEDIERAVKDPSKRADFKRYNLNLKVNSTESRAIDMVRWKEDGTDSGVDLREWPTYDIDLLIRKWGLLERPCYVGNDLSSRIDLTSTCFVFPPFDDGEIWTLLPFAWMPEACVRERSEKDRVPYQDWIERGFIETIPGEQISTAPIKERIRWGAEMFDLREVCFDPWNAPDTMNDLSDEGFTCVKINQTMQGLSDATKRFLALYRSHQLRHGNNPVLNFCASCLATIGDKNDNIKPAKPERMKSGKRIDLVAAPITAMARAVIGEPELDPGFLMAS